MKCHSNWLPMTWTMSRGQTKNVQLSAEVSGHIFNSRISWGSNLVGKLLDYCLPYLKELPLLGGAAPQKLNRDLQRDKKQPNGDHEKVVPFACKSYSEFNLKYFYLSRLEKRRRNRKRCERRCVAVTDKSCQGGKNLPECQEWNCPSEHLRSCGHHHQHDQ